MEVTTRPKAVLKSEGEQAQFFKDSQCSLTISVGQAVHEAQKLVATIEAVNKANFKACNIMVCDTLQRHTMAILSDLPASALHQVSLEKGNEWVARNQPILDQLNMPCTLKKWDIWLKSERFPEYKKEMLNNYENDLGFKEAMLETINGFISRSKKRGSISEEIVFKHSFDYLIEECAVQMLWCNYPYHFEIYPSVRNPILSYTYERYVKPTFQDLLKPISIKFKKRSVEAVL